MTPKAPRLELVPGEVLDGKYRVERLLGVGGMGAVYVAERLPLQDKVAIKSILSSQNTEINRARFLREARAAAAVRHPNVVKIFDFGEPPGRPPYSVMEYLSGPTLAAMIRDYAPMPLARALWIFSGICAAVEAGHRRGVVHRDLKPGNVILSRADDDRETVKVLDFGLARLLVDDEAAALTSPGIMLGTCSYMAPELVESNLSSPASDIYALGVVLYEMVTGRSPFRGENMASTIWRITAGEFERPADLHPELPQEVCAGIEAALSRDPAARPRSPEELAARVGAPLAASASDPDPLLRDSSRGAVGRHRVDTPITRARAPLRPSTAPTLAAEHDLETEPIDWGERPDRRSPEVFVGRAQELDTLRREYRMMLDGRGRVVVIQGDAGVGKSTLLGAWGDWVRSQGAVFLHGRFLAFEGEHPPPFETLLAMLGRADADDGQPTIATTISAATRADPSVAFDKWRALAFLTEAITDRARGRPVVIAVDDVQWATALDLELLAYLPSAVTGPLMVVCTAPAGHRSEDEGELGAWLARLGSQRSLATVRLHGFTIGEVRAWFQATLPGIRIRPQDLRRLEHATSGNPYYLTEVVGQLVDTGRITGSPQGYGCVPLDRVDLPDTVLAVVRAKLEGLGDELRSVLEAACVIGEEFRFEVLQAALHLDEDVLEARLEQAVARRLLDEHVRSPEADYRFETATLRSVIYEGLSRRRRRRLHQEVVGALLEIHGQRDTSRIAQVLCYHYHAIEDHEGTLRWGTLAAADTLAHYDHDEAETNLRRALEAATAMRAQGRPVPAHAAIDLDRLTGSLYVRIGRLEEADVVLQRALAAADQRPDDEGAAVRRLDILSILTRCQLGRGLLDASAELGEASIALAQRIGDRPRELAARLGTAEANAARGRLDDAALLIEPMLEADEADVPAPLRALAMGELASIRTGQGAFDHAHSLARQARALALSCGDLDAEHRSIAVLGEIHLEGSDVAIATQHFETALDMARRMSLRRQEGLALHQLAICAYLGRDLPEAEARAREALAIFGEICDLASEGDCRVDMGRIRLARRDTNAGRELLEAGRELCATVGRRVHEGIAWLELGRHHAARGATDEAREQLQRASEVFGSIDSLHLWRSELALADLELRQGDRPQAATHARRAAHLVEILRSRLGHALDHEAFERSVSAVQATLDAVSREPSPPVKGR